MKPTTYIGDNDTLSKYNLYRYYDWLYASAYDGIWNDCQDERQDSMKCHLSSRNYTPEISLQTESLQLLVMR